MSLYTILPELADGAAQVESIGEGVTSVQVGDHVIPLYTAGISDSLIWIGSNVWQSAVNANFALLARRTFVAKVKAVFLWAKSR